MRTIRQQARHAGLWYLAMGLTAPIALMVVPGRIIVRGDAAATAANIRNAEWLVRLGIGTELFHQATAVFLVFSLYRLFKNVNVHHARLVVALGALVSVPIMFLNTVNQIAALTLAQAPPFLAAIDAPQRDALAYLFLRMHSQGIDVASIFWGLWLFPFGMLVIRSGFIPRLIGVLMIVAGIGYLGAAIGNLLIPAWKPTLGAVSGILELGELPVMFWLLFWGARGEKADQPAAA